MHVAIIMDGNGRWAQRRGLPRTAGHRAGARAVRAVVEAAAQQSVDVLTLYAFSSDNWSRSKDEVTQLMRLLERYLIGETARCVKNGVRVCLIGRRDRLSPSLVQAIERTEALTAHGPALTLRLAVDYSARATIMEAARAGAAFEQRMSELGRLPAESLDVDLLIRTGGERRLSDFLLWECAYAELVFSQVHWPDFNAACLAEALTEFVRRERRFGGVAPTAALQQAGDPR